VDTSSRSLDVKDTAARVAASMARPGPSVKAADLTAANVPFAENVDLVAPTKYRCVLITACFSTSHERICCSAYQPDLHTDDSPMYAGCSSTRMLAWLKYKYLQSS
jgi:hypothetical protein